MNISGIREALAENLSTITGLQVSPYMLSNPSPPYVMIKADETEYDQSFGANGDRTHALRFAVHVAVPYNGDIAAQQAMDEYRAGDRSIKQALEAEPTLGGACDDLRVELAGPDTFFDGGLACEFRVFMLAND